MNTIIPAGYRITCVSWENDGDCYNTKIKEGLSAEETKFLVDLLKVLETHGNLYEPSTTECDELAADVKEVLIRHKSIITEEVDLSSTDDIVDFFCETVYELTGSSEHYLTREVESVKVQYIPQPIEMLDVTAEFCK